MNDFSPPGHLALTVSDLSVSIPWYRRLFGMDPALDDDSGHVRRVVWAFPSGFAFGLFSHPDGAKDRFDERRTGLDHLSFNVAHRSALDEWLSRLDDLGIEHGKIVDTPGGSALAFRDPDNIQLEFWANPA